MLDSLGLCFVLFFGAFRLKFHFVFTVSASLRAGERPEKIKSAQNGRISPLFRVKTLWRTRGKLTKIRQNLFVLVFSLCRGKLRLPRNHLVTTTLVPNTKEVKIDQIRQNTGSEATKTGPNSFDQKWCANSIISRPRNQVHLQDRGSIRASIYIFKLQALLLGMRLVPITQNGDNNQQNKINSRQKPTSPTTVEWLRPSAQNCAMPKRPARVTADESFPGRLGTSPNPIRLNPGVSFLVTL